MSIKSIFFVVFLTASFNVVGQLGLQFQFQKFGDTTFTYNGFDGIPPGEIFIQQQYGFGIDYSFRLKNYRVEFFPTLVYLNKKYDLTTDAGDPYKLNINTLGLQFNTHFYFLDIEGDCHCPTWSKDGQILKKGLFAWVSVNAYNSNYIINDNSAKKLTTYGAGGGLGLDIGLSKRITITPLAGLELERRPVTDLSDNKFPNKWMSKTTASLRISYHFND